MSVRWDVKWWPVSMITTPRQAWLSKKRRLMKTARETSKFQNWPYFNNNNRLSMAEIHVPPIQRKTPTNQSIWIILKKRETKYSLYSPNSFNFKSTTSTIVFLNYSFGVIKNIKVISICADYINLNANLTWNAVKRYHSW